MMVTSSISCNFGLAYFWRLLNCIKPRYERLKQSPLEITITNEPICPTPAHLAMMSYSGVTCRGVCGAKAICRSLMTIPVHWRSGRCGGK